MNFTQQCQIEFFVTVSLELITRWKNVGGHICGGQARRTVERIAYLWSRCSTKDRLFVLLRLAHASAVLFRSLYLLTNTTLAHRFSEHDRYRIYASFASKDFLRGNPISLNLALNASQLQLQNPHRSSRVLENRVKFLH